jgi:hypothetical protein
MLWPTVHENVISSAIIFFYISHKQLQSEAQSHKVTLHKQTDLYTQWGTSNLPQPKIKSENT